MPGASILCKKSERSAAARFSASQERPSAFGRTLAAGYAGGRGFTLIEMVVLIAIFSLIALMISDLFIGHNNLYRYYTAEVGTGRSSRLALDRMVSVTRQADSVVVSHSFGGTMYSTGPDTLVLELKTVDSANDFIAGSFDYVVWHRDGTNPNLLVEQFDANAASIRPSATRVLADSVANLSFSYDSPNTTSVKQVTMQLVTRENFQNSSSTDAVSAAVKLRNRL